MTVTMPHLWRQPAGGWTAVGLAAGVLAGLGVAIGGPILPIALALGLLGLVVTAYMPGVLFGAYLLVAFYKGALQVYSPVDLTLLLGALNAFQVVPLLLRRRPQRVSQAGLGLWIGMALLVLGGVLYAPDQSLALSHAVTYWALVLAPILPAAWRVGSDPRHVRAFLWTFFGMGVVTVLLGLLNMSGSERLIVLDMNTIQVSRAALLLPLVGVAFALRTQGGLGRLATFVLIPASLVVALASGSRGPLLVIGIMTVVAIGQYLARWRSVNWRRTSGVAGLALASVVVVSLAAPVLPSLSIGRFATFGDFLTGILAGDPGTAGGDTSSEARVTLFGQAVTMFEDQPLLGAGTGGFEALSPRILGPTEADTYPHNALLQVAAEFGVVGLLVFISLLGVALTRRLPEGKAALGASALKTVSIFFLLNAMVSGDIFSDRETLGLLALLLLIDAPGRIPAFAGQSQLPGPSRAAERAAPAPRTQNRRLPWLAALRRPSRPRRQPTAARSRPAEPARPASLRPAVTPTTVGLGGTVSVHRTGPPRIGVALYSDITYDSRVRREVATLARAGHDVTVVCLGGSQTAPDLPDGVRVLVRLPTATRVLPGIGNPFYGSSGGRLGALARRLVWLWAYIGNLRSWGRIAVAAVGPVDVWHAHDFPALAAIAPAIGRGVPLVYDSHEVFLDAGTARRLPRPIRALLRRYERHLIGGTAAVVTVNDALAKVLQRRYRPRRLEVVYNCPELKIASGQPDLLRRAIQAPDEARIILYHGGLGPDRGIEQLAAALLQPGLDHEHLVLLGTGDNRDEYLAMARDPRYGGRLHVLPPVPPAELLPWVASADVGGVLIQRSTLNHFLSTPNKLFECLAAGVPVVASNFPTMRRIVVDDAAGTVGTVCDPSDVEAIGDALLSILDLRPELLGAMRARCRAAAEGEWNWGIQGARLVALYREILAART